MYDIFFYRDKKGKSPIMDYIQELSVKDGKDCRIRLKKIHEYVKYLSKVGIKAGEPYIKHLGGGMWELRPLRDRILFVAWDGKSFLLLHMFVKKTQKTPVREIEQAKRNLADYRERKESNE